MPVTFAFSIAISVARDITRCPMPLSPLISAVEACSRTTRMLGRVLKPPALMRRAYCRSAAGILRQAADAMPVRALQIGLRHQRGDDGGIIVGQAEADHGLLDEGFQT